MNAEDKKFWDMLAEDARSDSERLDAASNGHVWERDEDGIVPGLVKIHFYGKHDGPECTVCGEIYCVHCYGYEFPPCGTKAETQPTARDAVDALAYLLRTATVGDILKWKRG